LAQRTGRATAGPRELGERQFLAGRTIVVEMAMGGPRQSTLMLWGLKTQWIAGANT
jgi:hypothetical protein